jgi:phosphate-selective porin
VAVVLAVVAVIVVLNANKDNETNADTATTTVTTTELETETEAVTEDDANYVPLTTGDIEETTDVSQEEETSEEETTETEETTVSYTLPTEGDTLSASFTPYKCITSDGDVISSDFNSELGGSTSISLNSDGTYTFTLGSVVNSQGTYSIDGNAIELSDGYSGTVNYDSNNNPVAVIISAEGYQVYFN